MKQSDIDAGIEKGAVYIIEIEDLLDKERFIDYAYSRLELMEFKQDAYNRNNDYKIIEIKTI